MLMLMRVIVGFVLAVVWCMSPVLAACNAGESYPITLCAGSGASCINVPVGGMNPPVNLSTTPGTGVPTIHVSMPTWYVPTAGINKLTDFSTLEIFDQNGYVMLNAAAAVNSGSKVTIRVYFCK
jgi:hypothetical protein